MMSSHMNNVTQIPLPAVKLMTAAGDDLLMIDHIQTTVQIQHRTVNHMFVVVNTLITPAILGMDFLQQHGIVIDFASTPVKISLPPATQIPSSDQSYKQNTTYGQTTVLLYQWQRARRIKLKTMPSHYIHRPLLWNFQYVGWITYRQLFMNSSNSFKHLLEKQILLTTTFQPQVHQYMLLKDTSQYITVKRCSNN